MVGVEDVLDALGNETRRRILFLLAERPRFVTEISDELNIGRKAIIDHLSRMENSNLIFSVEKRLSKGRPRKYYEIKKEIFFNVGICPNFVDFSEMESLRRLEDIEELDIELDELQTSPLAERRIAVSYLINKLEHRMDNLESEWVQVQRLLNRARKLLNSE